MDVLRGDLRAGRGPAPPALGRDHRQPVGQDDGKGGPRGYDARKKVNGRKRHILVDTLGLILSVVVHAADIQDRDGAKLVLEPLRGRFSRLRLIVADAIYNGGIAEWVARPAAARTGSGWRSWRSGPGPRSSSR